MFPQIAAAPVLMEQRGAEEIQAAVVGRRGLREFERRSPAGRRGRSPRPAGQLEALEVRGEGRVSPGVGQRLVEPRRTLSQWPVEPR